MSLLLRQALAFLKCQKNCPKAFWPIELSLTWKTKPLTKCINLEHLAATSSIVLLSSQPTMSEEEGGKREKIDLTSLLFRKRVCKDLVAGIYWYTAISSLRIEKMKCFVQHGWYHRQKEEEMKKKSLTLDHICLGDTANMPADCCRRMSYCPPSSF